MNPKQSIAIVGMSGRFPQAKNLKEFWDLLVNEGNTITEMPADRWNLDLFYDPDPATPNKSYQKQGSFLKDIHDFDPLLFNISPAEAIEMSPSQKLMLELTWEAIEEGHMAFEDIAGKKVGVYVGNIWNDFEHVRKHLNANTTSHSAVGQSTNIIANRVSYTFGFSGPSLSVDTGCSSALVALHLACQSIWDGGSDMCVVGGINHILDHDQYVLLSKFGGLSKKGQCSTFSNEADGFVRGEGAGVVIIKDLEAAKADGDNIIAVIKGTAVNNNGYNVNLPATSTSGQIEMLKEAYKDSGIDPNEVQYVEAHGTGTKLGDPTETKALGQFFSQNREEDQRLRLGSVKTNIGHLEGAAGMAGLLKVLLSMQNEQIPASLHFNTPNPEIPFDELKVKVNDKLSDWTVEKGKTRIAGVNSFGWGGTNAHTLVEQYNTDQENPKTANHIVQGTYLLTISAKNDQALKAYANKYLQRITSATSEEEIVTICATNSINKPELDFRISFAAASKEELVEKLTTYVNEGENVSPTILKKEDKIAFVFPGQGSQWLGMGKELYESEKSFQQMIDECEKSFSKYVDWSLKEQIFASEQSSRLSEIDVIQPFLFAMEVALAKVWMDKGIQPNAVVGHSMGEVASAFISGSISIDEAANVICSRSKLMKTVSNTGGAMAVTELTKSQAEETIKKYNGKLSVAVSNSPKSTVIAGSEKELLEVLADLEAKDLFCRQVKVDVASHSPQMDPLMDPLHKQIKGMKPVKSEVAYYSTVQNRLVPGEELNEDYWVSNLRGMVRFSEVVDKLIKDGNTIFIEMSPHPVLTNAVKECAEAVDVQVATIASIFREKPEKVSFTSNLGRLFERGYKFNWKEIYNLNKAPQIDLPGYPMQKQTFELEDRSAQKDGMKINGKNPLLGRRVPLAGVDDIFIWENKLSLEHISFVKDHKVNDSIVLPGVSYLEILHSALQDAFGNAFHQVKSLQFKAPIYLQDSESIDTQLKIVRKGKHKAEFTYYTKLTHGDEAEWIVSATGELSCCGSREKISNDYLYNLNHTNEDVFIGKDEFYNITDEIGIQYGSLFQGINWIRINNKQAIAHVVPNSIIAKNDHKYFIHPAILDSCFQTIFTPIKNAGKKGSNYTTFLSQLKGFRWFHKPEKNEDIIVKAELINSSSDKNGLTRKQVALCLYDESGNFLADLEMLEAVIIDNDKLASDNQADWLFRTQWEKIKPEPTNQDPKPASWLIFEDHLGVAKMMQHLFKNNGQSLIKIGLGDDFLKMDDDHYLVNFNKAESIEKLLVHLIDENIELNGIIHAAALNDHIYYEDLMSTELNRIQQDGSLLLINLHKALNKAYDENIPKLVVLTNGLVPVGNKSPHLNVTQAPLWGIGKVMFNEQPAYQLLKADMSYFPDEPEVKVLYDHIMDDKLKEIEIAVRDESIFASRMVKETVPTFNLDDVQFQGEGTVVVTGYRGAAFSIVERLIEKGVKHLALLSRSGKASEEVEALIAQHQNNGVEIQVYAADVSEYNQLKNVFELIQHKMPVIKGIVHAAGLIKANRLLDVSEEEFLHILSPKMQGTWNLHTLSLDLPITEFMMFSSESSLIGLSGQGSYVASNTFIDFMAHYRHKLGLPAIAINWGVIKDVGMVANEKDLDKYARAEGFIPFNMKEGVDVLDKILQESHVQIGIGKMDISKTAEYYTALADTNYFSHLLSRESAGDQGGLLLDIAGKDKEEAVNMIKLLVSQKVANITKASMSMITDSTTFKGLGIDSLMAIQLRNQLENGLGIKLAVGNFWKHPSIEKFSNFVYNLLLESVSQETDSKSNWWVSEPVENAQLHLYCFHDAGGSSTLFDNWNNVNPLIEVRAIELPGRGSRNTEQYITEMSSLVDQITSEISQNSTDTPFAFFGHSMGGAVAYEVLKELRNRNLTLPVTLFTSSTPALFKYNRDELTNKMSEEQLITRFPHLSKDIIQDEEIRQSFIKIMRSDLQILDSYKYQSSEKFDLPIVSLRGVEDPGVSLEQVQHWAEETIGSHEVIERPGGHRYLVDDSEFVNGLVNDKLEIFLSINKVTA